MSRLATFGAINLAALVAAGFHAYKLNGTFYASSVYFAQSRLSMIILGSWGLYCMFLCAKAVKDFFLGPLRIIELEHLNEYTWITLSEIFLAMTIFKDEIDSSFIFAFSFLMTVRAFHWILRDRVEYMEQVLQLPNNFIRKIGSLLGFVFAIDVFMVVWHIANVIEKGPSMSILFANEYALTGVSIIATIVRFGMNWKDALDPEHPFEQRSLTLFYLDFCVDFAKLLVYFIFIVVVSINYGIPIHILRDLYLTTLSFVRRARDMINYHKVMSTMDTSYPDVNESELEALPDRTCIICREEMSNSVKRLPCGHCFHLKCLKSWLERQQVCPTCRKSVLKADAPQTPATAAAALANQIAQPAPQRPDTTPGEGENQCPPRPVSPAVIPNINSPGLSPSGRSHASPQFLMNSPAPCVVLSRESEDEAQRAALRLSPVVEAELERFSLRSPLRRRSLSASSPDLRLGAIMSSSSPPSCSDSLLLSSLSTQIEYVEELLQKHQNLLRKLRSAEQLIRKNSSTNLSADNSNDNSDERSDSDEKDSLID